MTKFLSLLLMGLCPCFVCVVCGRLWCVCEVVVVPYVDTVVAVTVMRVLLFVLHLCLQREGDGARLHGNTVVGGWIRCGECRPCGWYTWFRYCV